MSKAAVFCFTLFVLAVGSKGFEMNNDMLLIIEDCATENSIDLTGLKGNILADHTRFSDYKFRCFLNCVANKSGLTNAAGELDVAKITQKFHPTEQSLRVITQCIENNKQDEICDRVAFAHICIMQELRLH